MQCNNCGNTIAAGERFCQRCGTPVAQPFAAVPPQAVMPQVSNAKYQYMASAFLGVGLYWLLSVICGLSSYYYGTSAIAGFWGAASIVSLFPMILAISGSILAASGAKMYGKNKRRNENIQSILAIVLQFVYVILFLLLPGNMFHWIHLPEDALYYVIRAIRVMSVASGAMTAFAMFAGFLIKKTMKSAVIVYGIVFGLCFCLVLIDNLFHFAIFGNLIALGVFEATVALFPNVGRWKD